MRGALWRSLAVFRLVSLGYATVAAATRLDGADRPTLGVALVVSMVVWSVALTLLVPAVEADRPRVLRVLTSADVVVCVAAVLAAGLVGPRESHAVPMVWATSGVFAAALVWRAAGGVVSALLVCAAFFPEWGTVTDSLVRTWTQVLLAGAVTGYLSDTALRAQAQLAEVLAARAGDAERARLARDVHDGVLQVLALIAREAPRGLPSAEVARLAAEQEAALRDLLRAPADDGPPGLGAYPGSRGPAGAGPVRTDLAEALLRLGRPAQPPASHAPAGDLAGDLAPGEGAPGEGAPARLPAVTVATPGVPVTLPANHVAEVVEAVRAALDNVARHAGPGASAWVLLEDDGDEVVVTVRDDGVGIPPGRVEEAAARGRLGLAVCVRGRIRELGGEVSVLGRAGQGTEVELRVPR
ncbi:MacS family sensor histidine kinase [Frankia nepalensis]|uniref:MacS family sensor histidine kinase n=1 Tax=Frankia nepalensis TaxID=1836974 RepID=UPI0027DE40D0|nr:ATP-binding protein [Frankia nepalensis]